MSRPVVPQRVTSQPSSLNSMDVYSECVYPDEKHLHLACTQDHRQAPSCTSQDCTECTGSQYHNACHKSRLRRLLIPAILSLFTITTLIFLSCLNDLAALGVFGPDGGVMGMGKRAVDTSGSNSTLVKNKLYLVIVFVGLLVVIILAVMLSAWCCRGAFENPLCCPCYLCACCGGLACLECIGCGLCAEGLENI